MCHLPPNAAQGVVLPDGKAMKAAVDCDWRHRIQRSSTADMEEESATGRKRNPIFLLKILCEVRLSRNISAEKLLSFSSRAIWTAITRS
jgi:hypothetical protein